MAVRNVDQLGMDERVVEDRELSDLLEKRLRVGDDKREIAGTYKLADQAAKEAIAKHALGDGDAIRVGRFRITKVATEARHVEFDAAPGSRLTIGLWEERDQPAAPAPRSSRGLTLVAETLEGIQVPSDGTMAAIRQSGEQGLADIEQEVEKADRDAIHSIAAVKPPKDDLSDLDELPF